LSRPRPTAHVAIVSARNVLLPRATSPHIGPLAVLRGEGKRGQLFANTVNCGRRASRHWRRPLQAAFGVRCYRRSQRAQSRASSCDFQTVASNTRYLF
jgi:hypothetical protein